MAVETIEQFVVNLEHDFKPNEKLDFNITNLRYMRIGNDYGQVLGTCTCYWVVDNTGVWDVLVVNNGETFVHEVISTLKQFLPKYKDNVLVMGNAIENFKLISTAATLRKFVTDSTEKCSFITKHPRIVEHNLPFLYKEFFAKFEARMDLFFNDNQPIKSILKYAQLFLLEQTLIDRKFENFLIIYYYREVFYQNQADLLKAYPDAKDVNFTLVDRIMVCDETLIEIGKKEKTDTNIYQLESATYSMKELLEKYTLTEAQLSKFFVQEDVEKDDKTQTPKRFVCKTLDILKTFEKV